MPVNYDKDARCVVPEPGQWPVDPQEDEETIREDRIFVDGCFDCFHHGHAGIVLQCLQFGREIYVGLHSDEDIADMLSKGRTIMTLEERTMAVDASRFTAKCVPSAPINASIPWLDHYGCGYAAHGDEDTSTRCDEDAYWLMKKAGRMKYVPRTQGISTTDLVGRMLWGTKAHLIPSLTARMNEDNETAAEMRRMIQKFASAVDGRPHIEVYNFDFQHKPDEKMVINGIKRNSEGSSDDARAGTTDKMHTGRFETISRGLLPRPGQRVVYVDGGFDLFPPAQIAFLESVTKVEREHGKARGWYTDDRRAQRVKDDGTDYGPSYIIAGVYGDPAINNAMGSNYPMMNTFERGLCVIQSRYVDAVILSAPTVASSTYYKTIPCLRSALQARSLDAIYHQDMDVFHKTGGLHDIDTPQIVQRIFDRRAEFEQRQQRKGAKPIQVN